MDKCSIPVIATCSGVEIGPRMMGQSAKEEIPSITLSLSIGIPVKELLAALSSFQQPPAPDVPDWKGSCGSKAEAVVRLPEQTSKPIRGGQGGQASSPPRLSSKWEAVPQEVGPRVLLGGPDWSGFPPSLTRVKVSQLLKRVRPDELRQVFEEHAGPVLDISVVEDSAILIFDSHENAKKAVDEYDGGILEASTNRETGPTSLTLHPRSSGSSWLEKWLGPLGRCHMRRGAGWITIFQATIAKQLKKDAGLNQVDFKGSFIGVSFDLPTDFSGIDGLSFAGGSPFEL